MNKRRSWAQRVGAEGEAAFRLYGARVGLLPNKVDEDVGIDFFCQIEGQRDGKQSALILPKVVGVNVRATKQKRHPRIRLDRADAEGLLQAEFPVFVALVHLNSPAGTVYHRFVDEAFAVELAEFLSGSHEWLYVTPLHCHGEAGFPGDLAEALRGDAPERVKIALAERGLSKYVPAATVEVRRDRDGELTIVQVGNFYDLFLRSHEPIRDSVYGAVFGAPERRMARLEDLGPRPELADPLARLPPDVWFVGSTAEILSALVAEGTTFGTARLQVESVETATHFGWVHSTGFGVSVSRRVERHGVHVHEIDAVVDPEAPVHLDDAPELWNFLEACGIGSTVHPDDNGKLVLPTGHIGDLARFHAYAAWLRAAVRLPGWDAVDEHLGLALDDESLQTLAWCAELAVNADLLRGFGVVVGDGDTEQMPRQFDIPVVGNLGSQAIVTWLSVDGATYEHEDRLAGFRISEVIRTRVEVRPRLDKAADWPEMVVGGNWPTLLMSPNGYEQTQTVTAGWDLQMEPS